MPTTWDENGNVVKTAQKSWDEHGNPIQAQDLSKQPITPREGESFEQTMNRAVEAGKKVTPEQLAASQHEALRKVPTVLGASLFAAPALLGASVIGPEAASGAAGGGILGGIAGGATAGLGSGLIETGLHAAAGESPFNMETGKNLLESTVTGGLAGGAGGLFEKVAGSLFTGKLARGMVNSSVGATTRDVTYGNPAVAMIKEGINSPITGDLEAYKAALRLGADPEKALIAAGGRTAQVSQKVQELAPQLEKVLGQSQTPIKVKDIIDKPLMKAWEQIVNDPAITKAEKDAATSQIGALQASLKEGLGETVTPLQANQIKQAIGNRINWAGNVAVADDVKPAYRQVYGSIKQAVNKAVPESAELNERLTNLLAAQTDLEKLMKAEEAGMGKGALGSAVTGIARRFEAVAGRGIPAVNDLVPQNIGAKAGLGASVMEQLMAKGRQLPQVAPNQPGEPFHPNQGVQ